MTTLALMLAPCSATMAAGQEQVAAIGDDMLPGANAPEMRVATIGYRLATRNVQRCARLAPVTGLLLHDLAAYDAATRPLITKRLGLGNGMGVRGVVMESAAHSAGLAAGDEIVAIGTQDVARVLPMPVGASATYERIEAFSRLLDGQLATGPVALDFLRSGQRRTVTLPQEMGCAAPVAMVPGRKPDAWSDQHYAAVTQGLAQVAGDDELAFALAHEMAHVVLGHAAEPHGALVGIGIGGKRSLDRERAADHLGILMALTAGYDKAGAEALLARFARVNAPGLSLTHPSVQARVAAIRHTAAAFAASTP